MVTRITGSSSGLDIDKLVSDLMKAERMPQTKLVQKQSLLKYETELYREINTKLSALRDVVNGMRYGSQMTGFKATAASTDVTVSVTSSTSAANKVINVSKLAEQAAVSSSGSVTNLGLQGSAVAVPVTITAGQNDKLVIQVDNAAKVVTLASGVYNTSADLAAALQKGIDDTFGKNIVTVSDNAGSIKIDPVAKAGYQPQVIMNDSNGALDALGFTDKQMFRLNLNTKISDLVAGGKFNTPFTLSGTNEFTINSTTITFNDTDTLQTIMNKVNSNAAAGVTMTYDAIGDKFEIKSKLTGSSTAVQLGNEGFLQAIKLDNMSDTGQDSEFTIDGGPVQTNASNSFNIDGIGYKLNKASGTDINIAISPDTDGMIDKMKKFITAYNDVIELVNKKLSETRSRGYDPLTDDQRKEMKDSDIALWDAEVKKGLLHNSPILTQLKNSLRELNVKSVVGVDSNYNTLAAIGITTVPYVRGVSQDAGKLQLDEAKFKEALAANPEAVNKLLTNNTGVGSQEGIMVTMFDRVDSGISQIIDKAGRTGGSMIDAGTDLGRKIDQIGLRISAFESMLTRKEDYYYRRFAAMETAVSNSNATINWLASQMG